MLIFTKSGKKALKSTAYHFCLPSQNRRLAEQLSSEIEAYKTGKLVMKKELLLKVKRFEASNYTERKYVANDIDISSCSCTISI